MENRNIELSQDVSIALGVIRPVPLSGDEWKMSDGNGLVKVTFSDKSDGDFLGSLRKMTQNEQQDLVKQGDILLCRATLAQKVIVEGDKHVLTKALVVTKVTAVSKRMVWV